MSEHDQPWPKLIALAYICLITAGYGGLYAASLMLHGVHKVTVGAAGLAFSVAGVVSVLQQVLILPRLSRNCSDRGIVLIGCGLTIAGAAMICTPQAPSSYATTVVGVSLMSMGLALISASICSLFARSASTGQAMGRLQLLKNIGGGIGPPLLGYAFDIGHCSAFMLALILGLIGLAAAALAPREQSIGIPEMSP